ncbi:MAG: hypothetical protein J5728_10350 [Lachnospiraceae bacterium]|nr:hypothetical protein [Lachnospiraceae bacterium]
MLAYLRTTNYFTAPSSFKCHGAWVGGNFDHSVKVLDHLLEFTKEENLKWDREESPFIIGLFHDLCKNDQRGFKEKSSGGLKIVSLKPTDDRHSEKSIELIEANILKLTDQERECILYHMGEYGGDEEYKQQMAIAMASDPNIAFVQKADTIAARAGI